MHRTQDWLLNCIHQVCWIFVPRYHMRLVPPRMKLKGSCRMWRFRYGGRRPHHLSHVIACLHILHIWSLKESVACDDSDTEAEGKMSSHAITKARSLLLWSWKKAVACDDSDTEAEGHLFVACYHMRLVPPHMKLKGSCRMWRFRYGGRRKNVVACNH